ncbi:MAG: dihydroneopterin aldolase family protein [Thermoplasmata archaeon]
MTRTRSIHRAQLTRREALLFEAGIKLGGLFHQYLGTPVDRRTARSLARAIEEAVGLQPYVRSIHVRIDPKQGGPAGRGRFAYRYLVAEMIHVRLELADRNLVVTARLEWRPDLAYPLMSIDRVRETHATRVTFGSRSARTSARSGRHRPRSGG